MSSFGGTVKLTGESEYQKALKEISGNLKLLNSEMKFTTSLYDKNDKSVESLASQNEVLNRKIAEQENKVKVLKDALAQAKNETGENSATTNKWQIKLNEAQAELNKLNRDVQNNEKAMQEATNTTNDESKAVKDFGEEAEKSGEKALTMGDIIKANLISDAIKSGLKALANGIKSIGSAMTDSISAGTEYADNILTLSTQTGLSTDTLQKYTAVSELADVSIETFTSSLAKTTKAMSEAKDGSSKYVEAYEQLGIKVTDANGNLRDNEDVYWETVDALKGISNETERDALAMELFGKKAQDLNPIVSMGSSGFKDLEEKASDMGAVLSGKGLEALGSLDDQMQIFQSTMGSTKNILASAFAPALTTAMSGINGLAGSFNGLISAVISGDEGGVEGAMTQVKDQINGLIENLSNSAPQILEIVQQLLFTLIETLTQNLPTILSKGAEMIGSLLQGIANAIPSLIPTVLSAIQTFLNVIMENLPTIIEMGCKMLVSLITGIADMMPELIPTIIDALILCVETILDNLDKLVDAGIEMILSLAEGLINAIPKLIDKIPVIIEKLLMAIVNNLPKIVSMGVELLVELAVGLVKGIPKLIAKAPQIVADLIKAIGKGLGDVVAVGKAICEGIWEGIKGLAGWLWDKVCSWCEDLWNGILDFFGIASPSKQMKWVGKMMVDGMAISIDENGDEAVDSAMQMSENVMSAFETINSDGISSAMADIGNAIPSEIGTEISATYNGNSQMSTYDMMVSAFKTALTDVKVVMDDREMGGFITNTVERVVFA